MADTETNSTEKAEKLAAARKRFEELKRKKQPSKKASGLTPQKESAANDGTGLEVPGQEAETATEEAGDNMGPPQVFHTGSSHVNENDTSPEQPDESYLENVRPESNNASSEVLLETLPEIYRKQASVIEDLRAGRQHLLDEVKTLQARIQEGNKAMVERDKALEDLASVSEELQIVKEKNGMEQATLLEGADEVNNLKLEVASLNRQIVHLQSQISQRDKTIAGMRRESTLSSPGPGEVIRHEERIELMSVELSESKAAFEALTLSANTLKSERDHLDTLVGSMQAELETAKRNTEDLGHKLTMLTESISSDNAKRSVWEDKNRLQEQIITELKQSLAGMELTVEELKRSNEELRASEKDAEVKYRDMERRLFNAQRENSSMQLRLAELKSSLYQSAIRTDRRPDGHVSEKSERSGENGVDEATTANPTQENLRVDKSRAGEHLWRQVLEEENSHDFLDIDLRTVANNPLQGQGFLDHLQSATHRDAEKILITRRIREELEKWRGHRINLVDVYRAYDDTYSRTFDI